MKLIPKGNWRKCDHKSDVMIHNKFVFSVVVVVDVEATLRSD